MSFSSKANVILTSSFSTVAKELWDKGLLPNKAKVAFIPTAGDYYKDKPWMEADRKALTDLGYHVVDVDLKDKNSDRMAADFAAADILFVAGGNTTYLTAQAHLSGFDAIVRDLLRQGKIYIGSSAGSILAGPTVEPFIAEDLPELPSDFVLADPTCLGLVDYIVLPHYPKHADENDKIAEKFGTKFHFIKITDREYRVENIVG